MGRVGISEVVPELVGITGQSVAIPDIYVTVLGALKRPWFKSVA